jgi:hypothetical protein
MRKICIIAAVLLLLIPMISSAQAVILSWADYEYELEFLMPETSDYVDIDGLFDQGIDVYSDGLPEGSIIRTNGTYAEFEILPTQSIVKLSQDTEFGITRLDSDIGGSSDFTLSGKLRMVAAKITGSQDNKYNIKAADVVCGVRGTQFFLDTLDGNAFLESGAITLKNLVTGASIALDPGQGSNLFGDAFESFAVSAETFADLFNEFAFEKLLPDDVPGHGEEIPGTDEGSEDEEGTADDGTLTEGTGEGEESEGLEIEEEDPLMKFFKEHLGFEIGSINIDGKIYSKAVIQPEFTIGKLGLGLYLPVIYTNNLFDPDDWHKPNGNNEWSFGTDQSETMDVISDILADLFLKIKYVKWGDNRDDFFFKVGNLDDMTIGHGLLMSDYANDANFPSIRRIGVNIGADLGPSGFEAVVGDLADPEIFGARVYFEFGREMAFGISGIVDIDPASVADESGTDTYGDPIFINAGFDLDIPIIENETFGLVAFADVGAMVPFLREDASIGGETVEAGLKWQAIYNHNEDLEVADRIKNYGFKSGVFGNIFDVKWNLEFRFYNGMFRPAFFNTTYERTRGLYVVDTLEYLASLDETESSEPDYTMGIYGGTEFDIAKVVGIELGYFWPWSVDDGEVSFGDEDFIHFQIGIEPGVIPVVGIYGSIYYDRTSFIPTILKNEPEFSDFEGFSLFDANTTIGGEIVYPVADTLDIVAVFETAIKLDSEGDPVYKSNGQPEIVPSISIETRVHF